MKTLWTFPGKIGDALLQFGVAAAWMQQTGESIDVRISEGVEPIGGLLKAQPGVASVEVMTNAITSYHMGGQPWDFGLGEAVEGYDKVFHCGFRRFPTHQITRFTRDELGLTEITDEDLATEYLLNPGSEPQVANRLLIHPRRIGQNGGDPLFWKVMTQLLADDIASLFNSVYVIGTREERLDARSRLDLGLALTDDGDWAKLADILSTSAMLIDAGSGIAPLAGALGTPTIRIHDDIMGQPKEIWDNPQPWFMNIDENYNTEAVYDFIRRWRPS